MERILAVAACLASMLAACSSSSGEHCPATALCRAPQADAGSSESDASNGATTDAGDDASDGSDAGVASDAAAGMHDCGNSDNLCPQVCPKHLVLAGGTRVLGGTCDGDCNFSVGFEFTAALEAFKCVSAYADLVVQSADGNRHEVHARLTQDAWDQLGAISLALEQATIDAAAQCTGCTAKASVRFHPADAMQGVISAEHEYPIGMPPAALRAADEFIQALIDEMASCRGPFISECEMHPR